MIALLALGGCSDWDADRSSEDLEVWSETDLRILRSMALSSLAAPPPSPSNRVAEDPAAVRLGRSLFFDPGLSRNGEVACSSCHDPDLYFTDQRATSRGLGQTRRNTPSVVGAVFSPWLFWDGRRDSLWSQALAPMETPNEMGSSRVAIVRYVTRDAPYSRDYRVLFGEPPRLADPSRFPEHSGPFGNEEGRAAWSRLSVSEREEINRAFANIGKSIAAYERTLLPTASRFDRFVEALSDGRERDAASLLDAEERAGLRLFLDVGRTRCLRCHNGPLLTNHSFHDVGTGRLSGTPDLGRYVGLQSLRLDAFTCLGIYSDALAKTCESLRFLDSRQEGHLVGAFRTPTLRGLTHTAPYLHDGSLKDLNAVIEYYRSPPLEPPNELAPLDLDDQEARQLLAFLRTLSGGHSAEEAHPRVGE